MNLFRWRAHALSVLTVAVASGVLSCRDSGTAPPDVAQPAQTLAAVPAPRAGGSERSIQVTRPSPRLVAARARLHQRNQMDWVGTAHNRALDAFRDELRNPGVLTRNVCGYLQTFAAGDARVPAKHARAKAVLSVEARTNVAKKGLVATELCGRQFGGPSAALTSRVSMAAFLPRRSPFSGRTAPRSQSSELSQAALDLYAQIESAIDASANSYDLAGRLNPVFDAAGQLAGEEYATIAATVSVAQSSYEYWEGQLPSYIDAVGADYGPCFEESQQLGYTLVDAQNRCMNGWRIDPADWRGGRADSRLPLLMFVARPHTAGAGRQSLSQGLKAIGKRDAYGAFTGAWAGAFAGGGIQGAALGALVGGGGASIATSLGLAASAMWHHEYR
jgi:hypothetical protein